MTGVAIIGMACRLPGAETPGAFWDNLCSGVESIRRFTDEELSAAGVPARLLADPAYVKAAPILADADKFDAAFFGFSPREASLLDPQQRLLLEVAWEAFEDAGYHPETCDGVVGVYAGGGGVVTSYLFAHAAHAAMDWQTASLAHLGNDKDFLATRVSYKLNLTGPSITVQTACSTSLVAVHLGCQSLLAGECDMVLAGTTTVRIPQTAGYLAEKGNVYSLDGHCRAFDAEGKGTIFGSGVAAVLLKRTAQAIADGDNIYAVIKGTSINNDGGRKVSFPAPSVTGQARAMVEAFTLADVSPDSVGYVECHATGTAVGDPQEVQALTRAFRLWTERRGFCALGSVKTNIGHPEQTAGLAGVIKTALALRQGRIPPTLHFKTPSPKIDFATSPFFVNTELRSWPAELQPRRAGVNALGIGGTNAFVVLEEAPARSAAPEPPETSPSAAHVLTLSAKTEGALAAYVDRLTNALERDPAMSLADLCYTTNVSRSQFLHRLAITAESTADVRARLHVARAAPAELAAANVRGRNPKVAFLFSGQGSQYPKMAAELYQRFPVFRDTLNRCVAALRDHLEWPLLDVLFADGEDAARLLAETGYTQPSLVAIEVAVASLWQSWGVQPAGLLGHSVGELAAACIAGSLEIETALPLVAERGRLMQALPKTGEMVVALASEDLVREELAKAEDDIAIAAVNSPQAIVVSGARPAVRALVTRLGQLGIACRPLRVSHAFHSPLMDPMLDAFEEAASRVPSRPPTIPLVSGLTGQLLEAAPEARYWRDQARSPVRFSEGIRSLYDSGVDTFLEVGPGTASLAMARTTIAPAAATWLPSLPRAGAEARAVVDALAKLYLAGAPITWNEVQRGAARRRVSLPTYPFQRRRHWLDPAPASLAGPETTNREQGLAPEIAPRPDPLIGSPVSTNGSLCFESVWSLDRFPYLRDHRIGGAAVLPTAVAVSAVLSAGRQRFGAFPLEIEGLVYHEILRLAENREQRVRLTLTPAGSNRANFSLSSADTETGAWRTHVSGLVGALHDVGDAQPTSDVVPASRRAVSPDRYYAILRQLGLDYGPAFRAVRELHRARHRVASRIELPPDLRSDRYTVHPVFVDACLHVFPALMPEYRDRGSSRQGMYLPVGIERLRVYVDRPVEASVSASLRAPMQRGNGRIVDIRATDAAARLLAEISGLSLRRIRPESLAADGATGANSRLYELRWEGRPRSPRPGSVSDAGSWVIFTGSDDLGPALAAELERRGGRCHLVTAGRGFRRVASTRWTLDGRRPGDFRRLLDGVASSEAAPLRGIVFLWPSGTPASESMTLSALEQAETLGAGGALFLLQALADTRSSALRAARLWLVTRNVHSLGTRDVPSAAVQALVWGLGRTAALEMPSRWGGLVDLPPARLRAARNDALAVAAEVLEPDGEDQIVLRGDRRFAARLVRADLRQSRKGRPRFRANATYLITGGLGMLGLSMARWLVESQGVRSLVLVGRRGARGKARAEIARLRARGARIRVIRADVSVEADVRRLFTALRRLPRLRGVFHGAGVLDDGVLAGMRWSQFRRVTAPKVRGSWLLHQYTRHLDLDVFVLHSSLLSVTGSAGQANYTSANAFMDALVDYRRALGLRATAINWGPWAGDGMARSTGARGEAMWKTRGVRYLSPDVAMRAFADALRSDAAHVVLTDTDWPAFVSQLPAPARLYADLGSGTATPTRGAPADVDGVWTQLREAPSHEHRSIVVGLVQRHVMRELGFEEPIDTRQPLNELGLDSLMSVNVANRLEAALGVPIPVVKLIRGPSIEQLVDGLLPELSPRSSGGPADAPVAPTAEVVRRSKTAGDGWLVIPRPNPSARVRLVCFPWAGAGAGSYRSWADVLRPDIEVVAVESPGHGSRLHEQPIQHLDDFFGRLTAALGTLLDRPVAFFGHCLGGLTAWETARHLRGQGRFDLQALFVSGVRPPDRLSDQGRFEETMLDRMLKHESFDPLRPVHEQPDDVFAEVTRHFNIDATDEFLAQPELRRLLLPSVRADFALTSGYRFTPGAPWDVPIICFAGLEDPYVSREDAGAWSAHTRRAFTLHWRAGAHFLVVDDRDFIIKTLNRELIS